MIASPFEGNGTLSLTERHLFSLFARYPEITFDAKSGEAGIRVSQLKVDLNSSPISTQAEDVDRSRLSNSTAQTTPLRPLHLLQHQNPPATPPTVTIVGFSRRIRQSDLPLECRLCFESLAQSIGAISAGMVPSTNGRYRINNTYFIDQCSILLQELKILSDRTKEQSKQINYLKSLIIFKKEPQDDMLWAVYRQRAQLVIRLTALPSASEYFLISQLANLYDTVIYGPAQLLYDDDEIEPITMRILNTLYDLFFTWTTTYRQWCHAMKNLKQQYMLPLIDRMVASNALLAEVKDMHRAKVKAEIALVNPVGPRMLPVDERTLNALNLSARRKDPGVLKRKARFRREKTI